MPFVATQGQSSKTHQHRAEELHDNLDIIRSVLLRISAVKRLRRFVGKTEIESGVIGMSAGSKPEE